jgi:hypothetical protein
MGQRIFAMLRTIKPLAGRCPSCELAQDALGCRIVERRKTTRAERRRSGVAEVIEVLCNGAPTAPVGPCPCCTTHPDAVQCPYDH